MFLHAVVLPRIDEDPCNVSELYGNDAEFKIVANGNGKLSYRWYKDGEPINDEENKSKSHPYVKGADTSTIYIEAVVSNYSGNYMCVVSNEAGSIASHYAGLQVG